MKIEHCPKHISVPIRYIKDDESVVEVNCPCCEKLLKPSTTVCHRDMVEEDFTFPVVDDGYANLLLHILDHGTIEIRLPNDRSISLFDKRYSDLTGTLPDRNNEGYVKQSTPNDGTYSYSLSVCVALTHGITIDDFWFSASQEYQNGREVVKIADNKWCHALLSIGFDLGRNHKANDVLEWIEENL